MMEHNRTDWEKAAHILAVLRGQAVDVLHSVITEARYEDVIGEPEGCYGGDQLAAVYHSQLKAQAWLISKSVQVFATTIELLAHCALVDLAQYFIHREAACVFID
jgi:hypothetical protein